jgi:hypothetical protein
MQPRDAGASGGATITPEEKVSLSMITNPMLI